MYEVLIRLFNWPALVGFLVTVFFIPTNASVCGLKIGETVEIQKKTNKYNDTYFLERVRDKNQNNYNLSLRLRFKWAPGSFPIPNYKEKIEQKLKKCMKKITPALVGPGGEKLSISVLSEDDIKSFVSSSGNRIDEHFLNWPIYDVEKVTRIKDEPSRDQIHRQVFVYTGTYGLPYENWNFDYSCPVMIHELMHFFGLEDEYPSNEKSCRSVGPKDSVMHNSYLAFRILGIPLTLSDYFWYVNWNCAKTKDNKHCKVYWRSFHRELEEYRLSSVRPLYREIPDRLRAEILESFNAIKSNKYSLRKSLLYPKQFYALIHKEQCSRGAAIYQECTKGAYRKKNCTPKPIICNTEKWVL